MAMVKAVAMMTITVEMIPIVVIKTGRHGSKGCRNNGKKMATINTGKMTVSGVVDLG